LTPFLNKNVSHLPSAGPRIPSLCFRHQPDGQGSTEMGFPPNSLIDVSLKLNGSLQSPKSPLERHTKHRVERRPLRKLIVNEEIKEISINNLPVQTVKTINIVITNKMEEWAMLVNNYSTLLQISTK
jgi:hypothetical protein